MVWAEGRHLAQFWLVQKEYETDENKATEESYYLGTGKFKTCPCVAWKEQSLLYSYKQWKTTISQKKKKKESESKKVYNISESFFYSKNWFIQFHNIVYHQCKAENEYKRSRP